MACCQHGGQTGERNLKASYTAAEIWDFYTNCAVYADKAPRTTPKSYASRSEDAKPGKKAMAEISLSGATWLCEKFGVSPDGLRKGAPGVKALQKEVQQRMLARETAWLPAAVSTATAERAAWPRKRVVYLFR